MILPILSRLALPTDPSPYLLVGSASGASFSLASTLYQLPAGGWVGALVAVGSLAGNLLVEREKKRRREAAEAAREAAIRDLTKGLAALEKKFDGLTQALAVGRGGETRRHPLRGSR